MFMLESTGDFRPVRISTEPEERVLLEFRAADPDLAYSELVERFRTLVSDPFGQDSDKPGDLEVYRNETGSWDPAESEKSDMTAEDFWALDPPGICCP